MKRTALIVTIALAAVCTNAAPRDKQLVVKVKMSQATYDLAVAHEGGKKALEQAGGSEVGQWVTSIAQSQQSVALPVVEPAVYDNELPDPTTTVAVTTVAATTVAATTIAATTAAVTTTTAHE